MSSHKKESSVFLYMSQDELKEGLNSLAEHRNKIQTVIDELNQMCCDLEVSTGPYAERQGTGSYHRVPMPSTPILNNEPNAGENEDSAGCFSHRRCSK